jgi:beta-N-acetylhexosaminidase
MGLLRQSLNFNNVVISDDLDMKAVADHYTLAEIIKEGILASVDLFIIGNNFAKTQEAIGILQNLIDNDETIREHAMKAAFRIEALRNRYLGKLELPDLSSALSIVRSKPHLELAAACR